MSRTQLQAYCKTLCSSEESHVGTIDVLLHQYTCELTKPIIPGVPYYTSDDTMCVYPFYHADNSIGLRCVLNDSHATLYINVVGTTLVYGGYEPSNMTSFSEYVLMAARLSSCRRHFDNAPLTLRIERNLSDEIKNADNQGVLNMSPADRKAWSIYKVYKIITTYENSLN